MLHLLLESTYENTPLMSAITIMVTERAHGDNNFILLEIIKALVAAGANVDQSVIYGITPLQETARYAASVRNEIMSEISSDVMKILIEKNANPNIQDNEGETALHRSFSGYAINNENIIRMLLDAKINPNLIDKKGRTALDVLMNRSLSSLTSKNSEDIIVQEEIIKMLRGAGALTSNELKLA